MNAIFQRLVDAAARPFGEPLDFLVFLFLLAAATAWVWLAARASAQAERTGRSPSLHFLLGVVIPFLWPWLMSMPSPAGEAAPAAPKPAAAPVRAPDEPPPPAPDSAPSAASPCLAVVEGEVGAAYFLELIRGGAVTPETPCIVQRDDGSRVTVVGLVDVKPELVVVNFRAADGSVPTIRIPYVRIRRVEPHQG
jgi:hypothetical protein